MRIAFIVDDLIQGFQQVIWSGVQKAALDLHVQCLTLPGGFFYTTEKDRQPHNILYDFIKGDQVDGFVIATSTFSAQNSMDEIQHFIQSNRGTPFVSLGVKIEGAPAVLVDNSKGLYQMVSHFIEDHGYRDLGFIQGPANNPEAQVRFDAFKQALSDHNIAVNSDWIREGNFQEKSGFQGMKEIWNSSKKPRAVFAANDQMILGAFDYLDSIGVEIPGEVALGGFDNIVESRFNKVPLSTVEQPVLRMAYKAVELLKSYMRDGTPPKDTVLETRAIFRESCGCFSNTITSTGARITRGDISLPPDSPIKELVKSILLEKYELDLNMCKCRNELTSVLELIGEYAAAPEKSKLLTYLQSMSKMLTGSEVDENVLQDWNRVLSAILQAYTYANADAGESISPLIMKSLILISEKMEQALSSKSLNQTLEFVEMQESLQRLMEAYDMETLLSRLSTELKGVGLKSFYLTFFEGDPKTYEELKGELPERSILHLNYRQGKNHPADKTPFSTKDIIPRELFKEEQSYALLCQVIFSDSRLAGLMICNSDSQSGNFFESLRSQLSSSIRAGQLMEDMKQSHIHLQNRNEAIQDQLVPMLKAIGDVSRITGEKIEAIEETAKQIQNNQGTFTETTKNVDDIAENARYMMKLIETIDDISERINLLSFNASIESARAGQHGKGFGVIAGEVRKLADSTAKNASQTNGTLKQVIKSIEVSKDSSEKSLKTYQGIEKEMSALSDSLTEIQKRMDELSEFSGKIMNIINT